MYSWGASEQNDLVLRRKAERLTNSVTRIHGRVEIALVSNMRQNHSAISLSQFLVRNCDLLDVRNEGFTKSGPSLTVWDINIQSSPFSP